MIESYLARIGLASPPAPTAEGLAALVEAQARAIPFENLDVLLGEPIELEAEAMVDKLVRRRRGGYCFELNGLLGLALAALGFEASPRLARVLVGRAPGAPPGPRTHLVQEVTIAGYRWLADAGFGGGLPVRPMPMEAGVEHPQLGERLRLFAGELGWHLQLAGPEGWRDLYAFTLEPVYPSDVICASHYTSTHPSSVFLKGPVASRPAGEGRVVLRGARLVEHRGGAVDETPVGPDELLDVLEDRFGIVIDADPHALLAGLPPREG